MSANQFGTHFKITTFGESHGGGLGVVIDGCPSGIDFDHDLLLQFMERRRPGSTVYVTSRKEEDKPEILSGVFNGKTLGTPIAILIRNTDAKSQDYRGIEAALKNNQTPRAGHADDQWKNKFGHSDHRGGGRSSGRETVARVAAGAVAQMFLKSECPELQIVGYPSQIGSDVIEVDESNLFQTKSIHLPSGVQEKLIQAREQGESYGGIVTVKVKGAPQGLGQPVFHKIKSDLASAMMSIGATTGFEFGEGFASIQVPGSQFHGSHVTNARNYGGIRGGITTGEDMEMRIAFKPTSSILDFAKKGRHDPCIVLRAAVVCEAMAWLVLADHALWRRLDLSEK